MECYERYLASGNYGTDRIWLAEDENSNLTAFAVWWSYPDGRQHLALDCLWATDFAEDRIALGSAVLQAGHNAFRARRIKSLPEYHLLIAPDWRNDAKTCAEVEWRRTCARVAGLANERERLRYEWTWESGVAPDTGRLVFRQELSDDHFLDVFRRVSVETLDEETVLGVRRWGIEQQALSTLKSLRSMRGKRDWWRLAYLNDGQLVGFVIPTRNYDSHIMGYVGVVPELRGHGYTAELLAEGTRILAEDGAKRIRADTDLVNKPMQKTFERGRYNNIGVRLVLWSQ
jgi:RimJ/RimL family protein N-acetyltransferase